MNKSRGGRFLSWLLAMLLVLQLVPAGTIASRAEGSSATSESAAATEETGSQEPVSSPTADDPAAEPADENLEAGEAGDEQQPTDAPSEEQPADAAADAPESEDAAETGEESVSADPIEEAAVAEPVEPDATAEPIPEEEPSEPVATVEPVEADPTPAAGEAEPVEPPVEPSATADPTESSAAASAGPMRIVIPPEPADTYVFYDGGNPPSELRRQTVVAGDTLIQPATLPSGVDGSTFLGWYANGTKLDFGAEGKLVITTVTGGAEITVTPKFSTVYHVTFFDEDNITVLSRRPVELAEGATSGTLAFDDLTVSSTNPYKEFAYWATAPDGGTRVDSPVTVTGDLDLYPVFSTGYWITFDANRTPAMSGVNVDYTPPQFVREGEATVAPVTPNSSSPAFVFAGWYTDAACTQPYTFGGTISANLTLYASWTETEVPFKIVVWTQDVSDDKDASDANKTYNSYAVYDSNLYDFLKAAAGSTVSLSQNAGGNYYYQSGGDYVNIATPAGRFVLNTAKSNTSATVAADGSTTLSLYYDRSLLTIHFYANGHAGQGAVTQDFTGLYGQTLAENGYTWPAVPGLKWTTTTTGGTTATFLDSFNFDEWSEATNNRTVLSLYANNDNGTKTINHFQQNLDGVTYPTTPANTSSGGGTFNISNKYTGFTAAWYRVNNGAWRQAVAGVTTVPNYNTLDIRYTRNSYTVDFYDGNQRLADLQMTKLFQAPLADVGSVVTDPANPAQYTFGGWAWVDGITNPEQAIDFTSMTMPPNNLTVYAIWVPVAYHVVLDVNGGTMDPAQATSFWPNYGEKIDGTWMNQATKARYVLVGWYSNHGAGTAWNFGNGITAALCDEGPTYDPDYQNYYYTVYLTAKWRLNETISINYVLPEGGTGTFVDPQRYVQDGSATILDDMPGHTNENYQFSGWLDAQGNLYQPGDTITLTEDLIETEVGQTPTVTLIAQFTTKVPTATITYRPNGGDGSDLLTGPYVWNESVALNGDTTFTRSGYKLIGWNSDQAAASSGVVEFACGASALVSAMGTTLDEGLVGNNDLYAVWTPVLTVTSGSQSWTYDGSSHTYQQYTLLYGDETISGAEGTTSFTLSDGIVVTITPTGSGAAGVTNVADSASNNNTFSVSASAPIEQGTHVMGTLTITKRAVTLTSATDSKVYDGTALTNSTVTVSGDGLADGEGATWDVTGTQTEVGTSNNTFTYTLNEGTLAENYDITTVEGTLTVTALTDTVTVTITENSGTELYDGSEKTVTGYTVAIDNPLYTEADFREDGDGLYGRHRQPALHRG
ncbi:MAG: InlB B-repeat-containing protein [Anaerolineae bacterium]